MDSTLVEYPFGPGTNPGGSNNNVERWSGDEEIDYSYELVYVMYSDKEMRWL